MTTDGGAQGAAQAQHDTAPYYQGHGTDPNTWWKPNHSFSGPGVKPPPQAFHMPKEARAQHYVEINATGYGIDPAAAPNVVYTAQQGRQNSIDWQWDYYDSNEYLFNDTASTQLVCGYILLAAACGSPGAQGQQNPSAAPVPSSDGGDVPWWDILLQFFEEGGMAPAATPPHSHVS